MSTGDGRDIGTIAGVFGKKLLSEKYGKGQTENSNNKSSRLS